MKLFWGCFIALIATAFAFFTRMYLCDVRFGADFNIDKGTIGALKGAGVWPFAVSIILFSLIIDKIGYRVAMLFSAVCYLLYIALACMAYGAIDGVTGTELVAAQKKGYDLLYFGSIILGLGNGTVEAFINPVVATMFRKSKTKWLAILHAGWPGGLVVAGIITIAMANPAATGDWRLVVATLAIPVVIYLVMLIGASFPVNEREASGVSYREMLGELGAIGAFIAFGFVYWQVAGEIFQLSNLIVLVLTTATALFFGLYTKSLGHPIVIFASLIMIPLATTEIGTDGWIGGLMEHPMKLAGQNPGWVLIYTSAIMMTLRFFAGAVTAKLSPVMILMVSSALAALGLLALSKTGQSGLFAIFAAATLYGIGKTFFWPTILGITAEQSPKGGALTLNAISGIGMIAVGVLGFPFIGAIQEMTTTGLLNEENARLANAIQVDSNYILGEYQAIDPEKAALLLGEDAVAVQKAGAAGQFAALAKMALFPGFMLICFIGLWIYFRAKGGYKAVNLDAAH